MYHGCIRVGSWELELDGLDPIGSVLSVVAMRKGASQTAR